MATTKVGLARDHRKKFRPWVVRWFGEYDPASGKRRRYAKSFRLRRHAEQFQTEKQAEFDKGGQRDRPVDITLGEFCKKYLARRKGEWRETTRQNQVDLVERLTVFFESETPLRRIRPEDAHRFWAELRPVRSELEGRTLRKDTRNRLLREAKTLFEYAVRWEYLPASPFSSIRQLKVSRKDRKDWRKIAPAEYRALLDAAPNAHWKGFYAVSYTAGLRFGEAVNLTADNLDLENGLILVRSRFATDGMPPFEVKDHEDRSVPIPKTTVKILRELIERGSPDRPFILLTAERNAAVLQRWQQHCRFRRPWTNRCMMNNTLREFVRHAKWAGLSRPQELTIHTLRKSCGQNWADHLPMHVTQAYMGHADITTTQQFYLQPGEEHAERARCIIEKVTMLDANASDAKVTPASRKGDLREVG